MDDCLFCSIVSGDAPSYTVYEDDRTKAFLDIFPSTPGHVVVILKRHGWDITDYTQEELGMLMATVQKLKIALQTVYKTDVFTIGINHKEPRGVHHLHIHILPRFPDDGGGVIQSVVGKEGKDPLTEVAHRIAEVMKK